MAWQDDPVIGVIDEPVEQPPWMSDPIIGKPDAPRLSPKQAGERARKTLQYAASKGITFSEANQEVSAAAATEPEVEAADAQARMKAPLWVPEPVPGAGLAKLKIEPEYRLEVRDVEFTDEGPKPVWHPTPGVSAETPWDAMSRGPRGEPVRLAVAEVIKAIRDRSPVRQAWSKEQIGVVEAAGRRGVVLTAVDVMPFVSTAYNVDFLANLQATIQRLQDPERSYTTEGLARARQEQVGPIGGYLGLLRGVQSLYIDQLAPSELRAVDEAEAEQFILEQAELQRRGLSVPAQIVEGVKVLIPYMVEFYLTSGLAAQASAGTKAAIGSLAARYAPRLAKSAAVRAAGGLGALAAQAGVRLVTIGVPHVLEEMLERTRARGLKFTPEGRLVAEEAGEKPFTAFAHSLASVFIEYFSEETGELITRGMAAPLKRIPGLKKAVRPLAEAMRRLAARTPGGVQRFFTKVAYSNFIGEMGEEALGRALLAALNIPPPGADESGENVLMRLWQAVYPGWEQLLVEAGVLAVPGVTRAAIAWAPRPGEPLPPAAPEAVAPPVPPAAPEVAPAVVETAEGEVVNVRELLLADFGGDEDAALAQVVSDTFVRHGPAAQEAARAQFGKELEDLNLDEALALKVPEAPPAAEEAEVAPQLKPEVPRSPQEASALMRVALEADAEAQAAEMPERGPVVSFEVLNRETMDLFERNPNVGRNLIAELENRPRQTTLRERAILLHEYRRLRNEEHALLQDQQDALQVGDDERVERLRVRHRALVDEQSRVRAAAALTITESAQALRYQRLFMAMDYTSAPDQIARLEASKGRPATPKEVARIVHQAEAVAVLNDSIEEARKQAEAWYQEEVSALRRRVAELEAAQREAPPDRKPARRRRPRAKAKVVPRIFTNEAAAAAKKRIAARLGRLQVGFDPTMLSDLVVVGGNYVETGVRTFGAWSKMMIENFGDTVQPYLQQAWLQIQDRLEAEGKPDKARTAYKKRVQKRIDELQKKLEVGEITEPVRLPPRPLSAEEARLRNELGSLQRQMDSARLTSGEKFLRIAVEAGNIPRTLLTSFWDLSGMFRQGRMLMQRWPTLAPQFLKNYGLAFASEDFALALEDDYTSDPDLPRWRGLGLEISELASPLAAPAELEERYMAAPLLERIPVLGKYAIRPTERSFTASLNWYRWAIARQMVSGAEAAGKPLSDHDLRILFSDINDLSGRATVPSSLKNLTPFVNMLFAPRWAVSRVKIVYKPAVELGRMGYQIVKGKPITVPNTIVSWATLITTNLLIMGLIKWLYPDAETEPDLRATDGGKVKIGPMRIDLWAGNLPYMRTAARLISGKTKTATGKLVDTDYEREILNVVRGRLNPLYSLLYDALEGNTYIGEEFGAPPTGRVGKFLTEKGVPDWAQGVSKETWNRIGPLTMQDFADTWAEMGVPAAVSAAMLSGTGMSVVTYPERAGTALTKLKDRFAQEEYGKRWEDLGPMQAAELAAEHWSELAEAKLEIDIERGNATDYAYTAKILEKERDAGKAVVKRLKPELRRAFKDYGAWFSLSRQFGDWPLNDERYTAYQEAMVKHLAEEVRALLATLEWREADKLVKQNLLRGAVSAAKALSLSEVITNALQEEMK